MRKIDNHWRANFARELSRRARASITDTIAHEIGFGRGLQRIGITGPPGAGKSTLIGALAKQWVNTGRVGVLAIDPTSPVSGGAVLGDRIRMEVAAQSDNLFIRSFSSGHDYDGLCGNISSLIDAFETSEFDRLIIETVGVGQVNYKIEILTDTVVLVLVPESGDTVQAMKCGILEMADIFVVNKDDLPSAPRLRKELQAVVGRNTSRNGWTPPVLLASAKNERGLDDISEAIEAHRTKILELPEVRASKVIARRELHLRSIIDRRLSELFATSSRKSELSLLAADFQDLLARLSQTGDTS